MIIEYDPATHVLVPREPSDAMMSSAHETAYEFKSRPWIVSMAAQYKAAIEASPAAPAHHSVVKDSFTTAAPAQPVPDSAAIKAAAEAGVFCTMPQAVEFARLVKLAQPAPANQDARDAARYRWMRDEAGDIGLAACRIRYWSDEYEDHARIDLLDGADLDSAIDAAMKGDAA